MIKRLEDLDKEEKIPLIQAIAKGQIDKECLNDITLVCTGYKDYFLGLMIEVSEGDGKKYEVVFPGEAQKAQEPLLFF